jgi:hypothetical protein
MQSGLIQIKFLLCPKLYINYLVQCKAAIDTSTVDVVNYISLTDFSVFLFFCFF